MKKILALTGIIIILAAAAAGIYLYKGFSQFMAVKVVKIDPHLTMFTGAGNSMVLTSEDGLQALVVDTKMRDAADMLRKSITAGTITIVNTHSHSDHTGGNSLYPQAKIIAGAYTREQWDADSRNSRYPDILLKPGEEKELKIGSETVKIRNMGRAHTANDIVVYLVSRKILATGDLVFIDMHPAVKKDSHASVSKWLEALDDLKKRYVIVKLVPGHGPISDEKALEVMKEYFLSIGDAIGNKEKLDILKKKYGHYYSLPALTSFDKTVKFIEEEKKGSEI